MDFMRIRYKKSAWDVGMGYELKNWDFGERGWAIGRDYEYIKATSGLHSVVEVHLSIPPFKKSQRPRQQNNTYQ